MNVKVIAVTKKCEEVNIEESLVFSGQAARMCYEEDSYDKILLQNEQIAAKRAQRACKSGHHSVMEHTYVSMILENIPKIIVMMLNNIGVYNTSEKSARYTKMSPETKLELEVYDWWRERLFDAIKDKFPSASNGENLAKENARYMISAFTPTQLQYTISLRAANYVIDWCDRFIKEASDGAPFFQKICVHLKELRNLLYSNFYVTDLRDTKNKYFSLFPNISGGIENMYSAEEFGLTYSTRYTGSIAQFAQAQRHRTISYLMQFDGNSASFYVPKIVEVLDLKDKWISDMKSVAACCPQGTLVHFVERGNIEDFVLKCKERCCGFAQLEIMNQTLNTLAKYHKNVKEGNLRNYLENYVGKCRCLFPDYSCPSPCQFGPKGALERII